LRELYEETNIRSVEKIGEIEGWLSYDIPREIVGQAWKGKYRGQQQKWYALRFTGEEREIDIAHPGGGAHKPEFIAWRWEKMENLPGLIIPFKRPVYEEVVKRFAHLA
jgi:putative (di)nucleoside polyphosphate hydrolase